MSRLEELIQEYCPNGVDFKPIKEVYHRLKGTPITAAKMKEIESVDGGVRIFAGGKTVIDAHEEDIPKANITQVPAVLVQSRGVIDVVYYEKPFTFKNEMWAYTHKNKTAVKFLYYVLKNNIEKFREAASGMGSLPQISLKVTEDFEMPIPPIEVQSEIVRILDNFTELTAELTVREKQYGYYRDKLLNVDGTEYVLEDVCMIVDCPHTSPKWKESGVPIIRNFNLVNGQIDTANLSYVDEEEYLSRIKRIVPMEDDILFSREAPIGNVGIIPKDFRCCQGQRVVLLRPNKDIIIPKFLIYILQGGFVREQIYRVEKIGTTVSNFNIADLKKLRFIVPTIETQECIIAKLDVFSHLCVNIFDGLPIEISARQRQYEYYRNRLLAFSKRQVAL